MAKWGYAGLEPLGFLHVADFVFLGLIFFKDFKSLLIWCICDLPEAEPVQVSFQ